MDCEKFEPLLLDELYEELDEVTSAAVKRHVSGCARCASILHGMRSTRRAVALPMLEMPAGFEDRILSSVKEAQKVVPMQSGAARALSWAGNWAMRPQTAMAAVFLLMIGTSAFVIRSRHGDAGSSGERSAAVSVTEKGEPAGQAPSGDQDSLDDKAAAAAHGPNTPAPATPPPPAASGLAINDDPSSVGMLDGITSGKGRAKADEGKAIANALVEDETARTREKDSELRKEEAQQKRGPEKKGPAPARDLGGVSNAMAPAGAPNQDYPASKQAVAPPATRATTAEPQDGFSAGMAAYRTRNYSEATRQFDIAARSGDQNAALWAAKSVKDGNGGCSAAVGRFEAIATKSAGTWAGNEASLESARCQIALGQLDPARDKLTKLTSSSSHGAQAQQTLNELNEVAARRRTGAGGGAGPSRPSAAPLRAPQPAPKPASAADKANGF